MRVLGAGLSRTGTLSTRGALTDLGLDPCIHGDTFTDFGLLEKVTEFYKGNHGPFVDYLKSENYQATLDWPTVAIFEELMPYFPDAKVLLTVRDSPQVWIKSLRSTVVELMNFRNWCFGAGRIHYYLSGHESGITCSAQFSNLFDMFFQRVIERGNQYSETKLPNYSRNFTDEQYMVMYENWIVYVKQTVPEEKLLVFNVKNGIAPLAKFCGEPVPNWPMPNRNDSARFQLLLTVLKVMTVGLYAMLGMFMYAIATKNVFLLVLSSLLLIIYNLRKKLNLTKNYKFDPHHKKEH